MCVGNQNRQNLVLGKNNQVSLTIGQILGTAAENTGWLMLFPPLSMTGMLENCGDVC
jgi:hypothetical protein